MNYVLKLSMLVLFFTITISRSFAQWMDANGPTELGNVTSFANIGTTIFAGSDDGVFRSTDNGTTWSAVTTGMGSKKITVLTAVGSNLFAGTGDGGGLFLSTDKGSTWNNVSNGLPVSGNNFTAINAFVASGTMLFAGTNSGVYRSSNNGTAWTPVNSGLTNIVVRSLAVSGTKIFAGTMQGIFLSADNGSSWTPAGTVLAKIDIEHLAVDGSTIYAGTPQYQGLYVSMDDGKTWSSGTGESVSTLYVSGNTLYTSTGSYYIAYRSTDQGKSFSRIMYNNIQISAFIVVGSTLFAGSLHDGIFRSSDDGAHWEEANNGFETRFPRPEIYSLPLIAVSDTKVMAGAITNARSGAYLSDNIGGSWTPINKGLTDLYLQTFALSGTNIFAGTTTNMFVSADTGANWRAANTGLTYANIKSLAVAGQNLFAGTDTGGIFRSTDNGMNWTTVNTGLLCHYIYCVAVSGTKIYAGTSDGAFLSTDNGANWTKTGLPDFTGVFAILVSGTDIFAATFGTVYRSSDDGKNWVPINTGIMDTYISAFGISDTTLFAGSPYGRVYCMPKNGTRWTLMREGLPSDAHVFTLVPCGQYLLAGTSKGVWKRQLSEFVTDVDASPAAAPTVFRLDQNYPNPFNPSTTISFAIPSRSFISLKVFDVLGREVATLESKEFSAGTYSRQWNASGIPSGVYFYRLQAGAYSETKRLVLLR